jgi:anti-sigma factor RsiW
VLVDLVDRGERGAGTAAALEHLDTCVPCEREITELALTIAALRRAGAAYRAIEVPAAPRLAAVARAVTARRRPWPWRMQLGGLMTSAAIAALLVAPRVGLVPSRPAGEPAPQLPAGVVAWQAVEHRLAVSPDVAPLGTVRSLPPRYPEGLMRPWKEVPATDAAARELEPS